MFLSSLKPIITVAAVLMFVPSGIFGASIHGHTTPSNIMVKRAANVTCGADPRMPPGSWDSHLHVMDPSRYPVDPSNPYTPGVYTVWDNAIFERSIGCEHVVFVASTTHGLDMTLVLDSLRAYGLERARAIALFEHNNVTQAQLSSWNQTGIRGVRVNLVTFADTVVDENRLKAELKAYADLIRPFDWVLQLYVKMETIPLIEEYLPTLGVKIVFDHQGDPVLPTTSGPVDPYKIKGFNSLARLLKKPDMYVKISGAYRFSKLTSSNTYEDVDPIILELLRVGPTRCVFGSDWPHTRFDGLNIKPWVNHMLDLTEGDQRLRERLFRDNARVLWGVVKPGDSCRT